MQTSKVVAMLAGFAALNGVANAGEVMAVAPVTTAGTEFSAKGKETVKLRFNGRLHFDYNSLAGENEGGAETETTNRFYFRRLRLGAKATLMNGITAETVYDFAGESANIDKALIGIGDFDLGYKKVPFGYQETISSAKIKTIERSVATRLFNEEINIGSRHTGIHYATDLGAGFKVAASLTNAEKGEISRTNNELGYFGRLQWANDNFTVGADYGHLQEDAAGSGDSSAYTTYVAFKQAGLSVLAEYFDGEANNEDANGYSVEVAYKFDKWEPVVRFSAITDESGNADFNGLIRRADSDAINAIGEEADVSSLYFGVNYYYSPAVKFMLGYEDASYSEEQSSDFDADISGFRARVQVLF